MSTRVWTTLLALITGIFLLAACANGAGKTVVVTEIVTLNPTPTPAPPKETITICMSEEPDSLYRVISNMAVTVQVLMPADPKGWVNDRAYFYETQMLVNNELPTFDNGDVVIENDTLMVIYHFKDSITWSDGEPFSVDDIIYTQEVVLDPDSGAVTRGLMDQITLEKIDDFTLKATYAQGTMDPLYFLPPLSHVNGITAPLPEHVLSGMTPAEIAESDYTRLPNPVLGPYEFVEWVEGDHITLKAVDNWWGGEVKVPNLIYRFISDSNQIMASAFNGDCDFVTNESVNLNTLILCSYEPPLKYKAVPAIVWEHIAMNHVPLEGAESDALPLFTDLRVRQAVAYGTNRLQMTEQILYGEVQPLTSYLPSSHWAWGSDTADLYPYDPDTARSLLADAGWVDSDGDSFVEASTTLTGEYSCHRGSWAIPAGTKFEVTFHTTNDSMHNQLSTLFQDDMAAIGIQINLDLLPASLWFGNDGPLTQRTYQIGEFSWVSNPDPGAWFLYGGLNIYRLPDGTFLNAMDAWDADTATLEVAGLDWETFAWGRPIADQLPEGYEFRRPEQIPDAADNFEGHNILAWCNKDATQAAFEGENRIDPQERIPYYYELQRLFIDDLPSLPLFQHLDINAHGVTLCGPDPGPANYESWNVETWYFDPTGACND